jgi:hypothetical protein
MTVNAILTCMGMTDIFMIYWALDPHPTWLS